MNGRRVIVLKLVYNLTAFQFRIPRWGLRRYPLFEAGGAAPRDRSSRGESPPRWSLDPDGHGYRLRAVRGRKARSSGPEREGNRRRDLDAPGTCTAGTHGAGSSIWRDEAQFLWIVRFPSLGEIIEGRHQWLVSNTT